MRWGLKQEFKIMNAAKDLMQPGINYEIARRQPALISSEIIFEDGDLVLVTKSLFFQHGEIISGAWKYLYKERVPDILGLRVWP